MFQRYLEIEGESTIYIRGVLILEHVHIIRFLLQCIENVIYFTKNNLKHQKLDINSKCAASNCFETFQKLHLNFMIPGKYSRQVI